MTSAGSSSTAGRGCPSPTSCPTWATWERRRELFSDAFAAAWSGRAESDGFARLVLLGELTWRQVVVLRAYAKYLRQTGTTFSQEYIERALRANVELARLLVRLFEARFDPEITVDDGGAEPGDGRR